MVQRRSYDQAPAALKELIVELETRGDYVVFEDEHHRPRAFISPLPDEAHWRGARAAHRLRKLLNELPDIPYSEEEVVRDINEAVAAIRQQEAAPSR